MEVPPHIAMFTTSGKGHIFPFVEFARTLLRLHPFAISLIMPDHGSPLQSQNDLQTIPGLNLTPLPPVTFHDVPQDSPIEIPIVLSVTKSIPALINVLADLNRPTRLRALIIDSFGLFAIEAVKELGIPVYILHTSPAMMTSFDYYLPELDKSCTCEYRDLPEPVKLPGCVPLHGRDLLEPVQDRNQQVYQLMFDLSINFALAEGVFVNSFRELEPDTVKALEEAGKPVYPVGPLIRPRSGGADHECIKWLDKQPEGTVLYVSFGSGGTLSSLQLKELAAGLEMSGQRFLFVVRKPNDVVRNGTYFSGDDCGDRSNSGEYLPADFISRTKGKGFVQRNWAPQIEILQHAAVGGFVTHCGWNSILESIVQGVPMIARPLFAEQRMNAVLVSQGLKVGFRVREDENGVVEGKEIAGMMRRLIQGEEGAEMRRRMGKFKEAAKTAVGENGSSVKALASVVENWK